MFRDSVITLHTGPEAAYAAAMAGRPLPVSIGLDLGTEDGDHVLVRWKALTSRVTL